MNGNEIGQSGRKNNAVMQPLFHNYSVNDMYATSHLPLRKTEKMKYKPLKVLICGADSYIGTNVHQYLQSHTRYDVHILDMINLVPEPYHFKGYDIVLYVAGIAHRKETVKNARLYFEVNYKLAVNAAIASKKAAVHHFILLSSMSVYGMQEGHISKNTNPHPKSHYGKSKLAADEKIWKMRDQKFHVTILRPPMVYGNGCKGNYQLLRLAALFLPVFPDAGNERSMIYIGNLCAFITNVICCQCEGILFPQNAEYINTSELVRQIAAFHCRKIWFVPGGGAGKVCTCQSVQKGIR